MGGIIVILMLVIGGLFALFVALRCEWGQKNTPSFRARSRDLDPRYRKAPFLTPTENAFADSLRAVTSVSWHLMAKVRLADLVQVADPSDKAGFNKVASKHVDFLLCDPKSLQPVLVVELDDASHERSHRRERDSFLDAALVSVGLPVVRFKVASYYDPAALEARLLNALVPASTNGTLKPARGPVIPTTDELRRQMREKLVDLPRN